MKIYKISEGNSQLLNQLNNPKNHGTVLFYHPGCFHCNAMKPSWEEMKQKLNKQHKPCNIYEINGENMNQINHPLTQTVQGFPTILNVNKGKINSFEKERNTENMIQFVLSNLPNKKNDDVIKSKKYIKKHKLGFKLNKNKDLIHSRKLLNAKLLKNSFLLHNERINRKSKSKTHKKRNKGKKSKKNVKKNKTQKK